MITVLPGRRSPWFGPLMIATGLLAIAFGVWGTVRSGDPSWLGRVLAGTFPALLGALFVIGGQMIAARRGGIYADGERLVLQGDGDDDRLSLPTEAVASVGVYELTERWGEVDHAQWVCEAGLRTGPRVLLGESQDEHGLKHYAHRLTRAAELAAPLEAEPSCGSAGDSPLPDGVMRASDGQTLLVRVGSKGRLSRTFWVSGLAMLVVGVVLLMDLANNDVMGFLFGPLLTALGMVLLLLPAVKGRMVEHIRLFQGELGHGYEAFGYKWGWTTTPLAHDARIRIRQRGLLGASLELVSAGRIRHLAGGVHADTLLDHRGLLALAAHLEAAIRRVRPEPPLVEYSEPEAHGPEPDGPESA